MEITEFNIPNTVPHICCRDGQDRAQQVVIDTFVTGQENVEDHHHPTLHHLLRSLTSPSHSTCYHEQRSLKSPFHWRHAHSWCRTHILLKLLIHNSSRTPQHRHRTAWLDHCHSHRPPWLILVRLLPQRFIHNSIRCQVINLPPVTCRKHISFY